MARGRKIAPARNPASLKRRAGRRPPRKAMLIVCEGATEKFYFEALREQHRLTQAEVVIPGGATGNDPLTLVTFAERHHRDFGPYDYIFCVFDRDVHASFGPARQRIRELAGRPRKHLPIAEAISIPSFEIWVLQHFEQTDRPFVNADAVIAHLKAASLPGYVKADVAIARSLVQRVDAAIANATWLVQRNEANGSDNPSTNLHSLALKIREMAGA
jgi:hypothetical protein